MQGVHTFHILGILLPQTKHIQKSDQHWDLHIIFVSFRLVQRVTRATANRTKTGARAAQQVPHVHFHIIPRPSTESSRSPSFAMFGRGQRDELDDEEGEKLAHSMRVELAEEVRRIERDEGVVLDPIAPGLKPRGKL